MNNDLCRLSASDLLNLYRKKDVSPLEVTRAVLKRIDELNPKLNAFCFIASDAEEKARQSETRWMRGEPMGLLDGVPVSEEIGRASCRERV